jgi:hypothetical protein
MFLGIEPDGYTHLTKDVMRSGRLALAGLVLIFLWAHSAGAWGHLTTVSRGNACEETANGGQEICGEPIESYNMRTVNVFLPSGVQTRLYDELGYCPRRLPADLSAHIEALWTIRQAVPEGSVRRDRRRNGRASLEGSCPFVGSGCVATAVFPAPARESGDDLSSDLLLTSDRSSKSRFELAGSRAPPRNPSSNRRQKHRESLAGSLEKRLRPRVNQTTSLPVRL